MNTEEDGLKLHRTPEKVGLPKDLIAVRPLNLDLFFCGIDPKSSLPPEVSGNLVLLEQAVKRRELSKSLDDAFDKVKDSDTDFYEALGQGILSSEELSTIYDQLSEFINTDENNCRILLYLPIQLLPRSDQQKKLPGNVFSSLQKLNGILRDSWIRLLHETEARTSFSNGDILEEGMEDPERICKAGHLTADFLDKGIVSPNDIIALLKIVSGEYILKSLTEGLIVARDRQLINDDKWEQIVRLSAKKDSMAAILRSAGRYNETKKKSIDIGTAENTDEWAAEIFSQLKDQLTEIQLKYQPKKQNFSPERANWLVGVEKDSLFSMTAEIISPKLISGEIDIKDLERFYRLHERTPELEIVVLRSIFISLEELSKKNPQKVELFRRNYWPAIEGFWEKDSMPLKDEIISGLGRLQRLYPIDQNLLDLFNIKVPDLSLATPTDTEQLALSEYNFLIEAVQKIKENQKLSANLYPVVLLYGSRSKGYALPSSDVDVAIFVKPGVQISDRDEMLKELDRSVPELKKAKKIVEFWTENKDGQLDIRPVPEGTVNIVGTDQIRFLMEGIWFGQKEEISQLSETIINEYLDLDRFGNQKQETRRHLLRQLEMGFLQYRLLHKGFRTFYPPQKDKGTLHADLIDWESDFWDPGYRRLATKLFISHVFLPDLGSK